MLSSEKLEGSLYLLDILCAAYFRKKREQTD